MHISIIKVVFQNFYILLKYICAFPITSNIWKSTDSWNPSIWKTRTWNPSQYKDCLSHYGDSHYKDKTDVRPFYLYNRNPDTGKINGSVQARHNSIANVLELCLSCSNPLRWCLCIETSPSLSYSPYHGSCRSKVPSHQQTWYWPNKIWRLCLVPTSTTRYASEVGYRMAKNLIG